MTPFIPIGASTVSETKHIEDGGPAFPTIQGYVDSFGSLKQKSTGLSLRDWLAGQALSGLVGNPGGPYQANSQSGWDIVNCDMNHVANTCYELADAMIAARAKDR